MSVRLVTTACILGAASLAQADFSYEETSKITGGAMAGMMKMAGAFSKAAREPMRSTISVQGNRMARMSASRGEVIDLDAETITTIDLQKKTYSVVTFEQFRQMMADASKKMAEKTQGSPNGEMNLKLSLKDTGAKKDVGGYPAHEVVMNIAMEGTNKDTGDKGSLVVTSDMWLSPSVAGYKEVQAFQRRMAEKIAYSPTGMLGAMAAQNADLVKGMAALYKEAGKMDGLPVLLTTRMGFSKTGEPLPPASPAGETTTPSAGSVASQAASETAANAVTNGLGRLTGLGGLGGFGRKKKDAQPPTDAASTTPAQSTTTADAGVLMEMQTEATNFSSNAVDASRFAVPAGFKQVEPEVVGERRPR